MGRTKDKSKIRNKAIAKEVLINCIKNFDETMGTSYEQGKAQEGALIVGVIGDGINHGCVSAAKWRFAS